MKKHIGDKEDTDIIGNFLMLVGSFLLSLVILDYIKMFMSEISWFNYLIVFGIGYLIYLFGFYILQRDKVEIISSIKNLLLVVGLILALCIITFI